MLQNHNVLLKIQILYLNWDKDQEKTAFKFKVKILFLQN